MLLHNDVLINNFEKADNLSTAAGFNTTELLSGKPCGRRSPGCVT